MQSMLHNAAKQIPILIALHKGGEIFPWMPPVQPGDGAQQSGHLLGQSLQNWKSFAIAVLQVKPHQPISIDEKMVQGRMLTS